MHLHVWQRNALALKMSNIREKQIEALLEKRQNSLKVRLRASYQRWRVETPL